MMLSIEPGARCSWLDVFFVHPRSSKVKKEAAGRGGSDGCSKGNRHRRKHFRAKLRGEPEVGGLVRLRWVELKVGDLREGQSLMPEYPAEAHRTVFESR